MENAPEPITCQEVTWKGKRCTRKARYRVHRINQDPATGNPVCGTHLNAFPAGMPYTPIEENA